MWPSSSFSVWFDVQKKRKGNVMSECCEPKEQMCCSTEKCRCKCKCECPMPGKLLCLADQAWMELVKEKIKAEIDAKCGAELKNLAEIVSQANCEKWHAMVAGKQRCEQYQNDVRDFFQKGHTKS